MKNILGLFSLFLLFNSCSTDAEPINYGSDQCNFCKMNIVDSQHAAQYVTKKGKQFKFDAIECMVNELADLDENNLSVLLVSDYGQPGEMTDALTATYLISPGIKSPMGAFLSAFNEKEKAASTKEEFTGELYTWESLKTKMAEE